MREFIFTIAFPSILLNMQDVRTASTLERFQPCLPPHSSVRRWYHVFQRTTLRAAVTAKAMPASAKRWSTR